MQQTRNPCASEPKEPAKQRKQGGSDKADPARLPALGSEDLVGRQTMACKIKYTILALAVTLLLSGLLLAQGYGDDDDDDGGYYRGRGQAQAQQYGYENGHGGYGGYNSPAYNIGYQDGSTVAREDIESHKKFNPDPRGRYDDKDHGYSREYGDKNEYKSEYTAGYRDGYQTNFRGYGRY